MSPKQQQSANVLAQLTREIIRGTEYPHTREDWPQAVYIAITTMHRIYPSIPCGRTVINHVRAHGLASYEQNGMSV